MQKKFEYIREKIDQISTQIQKIAGNTPTSTPTTSTPIPTLIKLLSSADIIKKGSITTGNIPPYIKIL